MNSTLVIYSKLPTEIIKLNHKSYKFYKYLPTTTAHDHSTLITLQLINSQLQAN